MKKIYFFLSLFVFVIAAAASAQVVINEVYGGGGNTGATYRNDFIELYNNGATAVDLTGWSVQYTSSAGTTWTAGNATNLSGTIPAHGYFLIQEAAGAGGTTNLPTPDVTGTIAMAAGAGKVLLCNVTTLQSGANPTGLQIVDKVGYGTATTLGFEGAGPTPTISATVSAQRNPAGADADNNSTDFITGAPTPSNSGTGFGTTVIVAAGVNAAEPATSGSFLVTLSSAAPAGGVTIVYTLAGTTTIGSDYTDPQAGSVTIAEGQSSGTITLAVINDAAFENDENIAITLTSATAPYTITTATAAISLFSDDINPVALTGPLYVQDFNTLANAGTGTLYSLLPTGWAFAETGTAANTIYTAGTGSSTAGDTYSFGAAANTERAFGTVQSGSLVPAIGAQFVNNTGSPITSVKISYTGEQWRLGLNDRLDKLDFQYSLDAGGLSSGTWTDVDQLDFTTPDTLTTSLGALDGNAAPHKVLTAYTITGLSIAPGAVFSIRWNDFNATSSDDGLAVDDFSLEVNPADNNAPTVAVYSPAVNSTNAAINLTGQLTFNESVAKGTGNIVLKRASDDAIIQTIDVSSASVTIAGNTVSFPVATLVNGVGYYFNIDATAFADLATNNFAGISDKTTWAFTTSSTAMFATNFATCTGGAVLSDGFMQYSVTGAITWACTSFGRTGNGVQINGYDAAIPSNVQNEDWLISPSYNLTGTVFPLLSFWSRTAFNGLPLQLKISTDYSGSGDPALATWTDLNGRFPAQASDAWTFSQNINLSAFKQANVHIAWVYTSSDDDGARWTLDDVVLDNSPTPPPPVLAASTGNLEFFFTAAGSTLQKQFTILGNDLAGGAGINIASSDASFLVSKDNAAFAPSINFTEAEANNITKTVYVRFAPAQNDKNFTATVTISTAGAADTLVSVKGTSIDPVKTLEVVNWNMEWFSTPDPTPGFGPANKALQRQNAQTILTTIGADLYALTEVVDTAALGTIVRNFMPGYSYVICNYGSHGNTFEAGASPMGVLQKEAFVYKTSVFSNVDTASLLSVGINTEADLTNPDYNNWSSGRYPFMMTADVTLGGVTKQIRFVNVHAKANTSPTLTSYARRQAGAISLHNYLNSTYPGDNIVILGDFNDDLDSTITAGIAPRYSSYKVFTDDAASFYSPSLVGLSLTGKKSTVAATYTDMIDHVVVSNEMQPFYMGASAAVLTDVTSLVANYGSTTSDHYPVFTRYAFDAALLPVRLTSFAAAKDGNTVKLTWTSAEEINSSYYNVQRSANGVGFSNIGTVTAKGVAADYMLTDATPLAGANYYRLQPVDKDGKSSFSKVVKVDFSKLPGIRISPNPASSYLYISLDNMNAAVNLQLIDANGRLVKQQVIAQGLAYKTIGLDGVAKGLYTVKMITQGQVTTQKILVQ